jgi:hypothetical protein
MLFCRANWGYFAALQTVALIGAANNGGAKGLGSRV